MCAISHIEEVFEISKSTFCRSQIDATMVGGLIKSGTLGRGLMTLVPTCWSVCVLEMAKESGHANLLVSVITPAGQKRKFHISTLKSRQM